MDDQQLALPLTADLALQDAVAQWKHLDPDPLLHVGDTLNEINNRSQLALGAWLTVYEDILGYGGIKDMADRWDRKAQTLRNWKSVYKKTRNIPHAVHSLPFSKVSELARIPESDQEAWLTLAMDMKRAELRAAVREAKRTGDWTPPKDHIVVMAAPISTPQEPESSDILSFTIGRLAISVRWEKEARH